MTKAEEYRTYAATCRQQADKGTDARRALWLKIAQEWERIAVAAERNPDAF